MTTQIIALTADASRKEDFLSRQLPAGYKVWETMADPNPIDRANFAAWFILTDDAMEIASRYQVPETIPVLMHAIEDTLSDTAFSDHYFRINALPGFLRHPRLELAARNGQTGLADQFFQNLGWPVEWVADIPGLVTPRVIAMLVNEACYAVGEDISEAGQIDIAMKLGTNYPKGPFEWSSQIGHQRILALLQRLESIDPMYTPAPGAERILQSIP